MAWLPFEVPPLAYRVERLLEPGPCEEGLDRAAEQIPWSRVRRVLAAEVGEPQGVRVLVLDLVVDFDGHEAVAYRLSLEPGPESGRAAAEIERRVAPGAVAPALRDLARNGRTSRWFPDIESFEAANRSALDPPASGRAGG